MKTDVEYFTKKHVTKRDESLFSNDLKSFLPNCDHIETGKNLDQKM